MNYVLFLHIRQCMVISYMEEEVITTCHIPSHYLYVMLVSIIMNIAVNIWFLFRLRDRQFKKRMPLSSCTVICLIRPSTDIWWKHSSDQRGICDHVRSQKGTTVVPACSTLSSLLSFSMFDTSWKQLKGWSLSTSIYSYWLQQFFFLHCKNWTTNNQIDVNKNMLVHAFSIFVLTGILIIVQLLHKLNELSN